MKSKLFAAVGVCIALAVASSAQTTAPAKAHSSPAGKGPLKLVQSIPLPSLKAGDFDHFAIDLEGHRLFLTAEENGKLLVFDTNENKLIHTIEDLKAPHAVLYRKEFNKLFVVDGDESAVKIYDAQSYKPVEKMALDPDADSMAYDPAAKYMYVVNGGREAKTPYSFITVLDLSGLQKDSRHQDRFGSRRSCRSGEVRAAAFLQHHRNQHSGGSWIAPSLHCKRNGNSLPACSRTWH